MSEIPYELSLGDLQRLSDLEISKLMVSSDSARKNDVYRAECTYWMCIMEIHRRSRDELFPESVEVKCLESIYDQNVLQFECGKTYTMYAVDCTMLIFTDDMRPYAFNIIDDDNYCVWKYFGIGNDNSSSRYKM